MKPVVAHQEVHDFLAVPEVLEICANEIAALQGPGFQGRQATHSRVGDSSQHAGVMPELNGTGDAAYVDWASLVSVQHVIDGIHLEAGSAPMFVRDGHVRFRLMAILVSHATRYHLGKR